MNKNIEMILVKTATGYSVSNKTDYTIDFFDDTDDGRKRLLTFLANNLLNEEVIGGRKYN
jgi:hypothetical protein